MRLLAVANRYPPWSTGGYEVVSSNAVACLRSTGHQVGVLTTGPDPSDVASDPAPPGVRRDLRWYWHDGVFPPIGLGAAARLERHNAGVLRRRLAELVPEAVIWWGMGGMSLSLIEQVRRTRLPALGLVGDEWMNYGPQVDGWIRRWSGRWGRLAPVAERLTRVPGRVDLDRGGRWLFNSHHLLSAARQAGWSLPDAGILPPGIDLGQFSPQPPHPWRWRILYLGRIDPRKGIATAVEALAELPSEATLAIHGDGDRDFLAELTALADRLGVAERVTLARSEHRNVAAAYAEADAVVFPVLWREPWGLVPLEAMAVGRPLLASRAGGGPAEYLEEGRNCLQFKPGDPHELAAGLRRLADQPQLRQELISAGRATASRFSAEAFHERLEYELRQLTSEIPRGRV